MIYLDNSGLDTQNYNFDYVRREFLGEVRTLVFDVTPRKKAGNGRFIGRIWVEDQDYTIVRFNGSYTGRTFTNLNFHFDSWRVNAGPNLWLPAFIYSEESTSANPIIKAPTYKAQTRLWGYDAGRSRQEQELSQVLIESSSPVIDQSKTNNDLAPVQEARAWDAQAEDNVMERLQRSGLIAPKGEIDKILQTVVNNLEVTNNLDVEPEIQCRVLMTSTLESFSMGHTIVLSRGLIDVLPDEASLAAMLAKEMGYILTNRKPVDTRLAFYDRLQFADKKMFDHFDFERKPEEDAAAIREGLGPFEKFTVQGSARDRGNVHVRTARARPRDSQLDQPSSGRCRIAEAFRGRKIRRRGSRATYRRAAAGRTRQAGPVGRFPGALEGPGRGKRLEPRENAV